MSNFSQRLNKLEPPSQHSEYLKEVCLRLMRYAIECRNHVKTGGSPEQAEMIWSEVSEKLYAQWQEDSSFAAFEREVLASPVYFAAPSTSQHSERPANA